MTSIGRSCWASNPVELGVGTAWLGEGAPLADCEPRYCPMPYPGVKDGRRTSSLADRRSPRSSLSPRRSLQPAFSNDKLLARLSSPEEIHKCPLGSLRLQEFLPVVQEPFQSLAGVSQYLTKEYPAELKSKQKAAQ